MTGAYLRVKRDERWQNIEVEYLTDTEREELFANRSSDELVRWLNLLSKAVGPTIEVGGDYRSATSAPSYHARIMALPTLYSQELSAEGGAACHFYDRGCQDTRHAAAEVAAQSDAEIARLRDACAAIVKAVDTTPPSRRFIDHISAAICLCRDALANPTPQ